METPKRHLSIMIVNILVVFATLLILAALVVPVFVPPKGHAASRVSAPNSSRVVKVRPNRQSGRQG